MGSLRGEERRTNAINHHPRSLTGTMLVTWLTAQEKTWQGHVAKTAPPPQKNQKENLRKRKVREAFFWGVLQAGRPGFAQNHCACNVDELCASFPSLPPLNPLSLLLGGVPTRQKKGKKKQRERERDKALAGLLALLVALLAGACESSLPNRPGTCC